MSVLQKVYTASKEQAVVDILTKWKRSGRAMVHFLYFANVMHYRLLEGAKKPNQHDYLSALQQGDFVLPDGIALQIFYWLGEKTRPWIENLNGTDFTPFFLDSLREQSPTIHLYGATHRVVEGVKELLVDQGYEVGHLQDGFSELDRSQLAAKKGKQLQVLLVARGTPLQEIWVEKYRAQIQEHGLIVLTVGGFFDFYAGEEVRAPDWVVKARVLETFRRITTNPRKNLKKFVWMFGIVRYWFSLLRKIVLRK